LDPRISKVEDQFAGKYGWTPNRATRIWETNPGYKTYNTSAVTPGVPPKPSTDHPPPPGSAVVASEPPRRQRQVVAPLLLNLGP
jgi:hypothetical protein